MNEQTESMDKVTQNLMHACEDMGAIAREQVNAVMQSSAAVMKGYEELSRCYNNQMQDQMARAVSAGKIMMNARTMKEFFDMQNEFMKDCLDSWMAETGKWSEISTRTTQEAIEPVTKQANAAISKFSQMGKAAA